MKWPNLFSSACLHAQEKPHLTVLTPPPILNPNEMVQEFSSRRNMNLQVRIRDLIEYKNQLISENETAMLNSNLSDDKKSELEEETRCFRQCVSDLTGQLNILIQNSASN